MENFEAERNFSKPSTTENNQAGEKTELSFYSLYRRRYYKIVAI